MLCQCQCGRACAAAHPRTIISSAPDRVDSGLGKWEWPRMMMGVYPHEDELVSRRGFD